MMTRQVRVPWRRAGPSNLVIMLAATASLRGSILRIDTLKAENTLGISHVQISPCVILAQLYFISCSVQPEGRSRIKIAGGLEVGAGSWVLKPHRRERGSFPTKSVLVQELCVRSAEGWLLVSFPSAPPKWAPLRIGEKQ